MIDKDVFIAFIVGILFGTQDYAGGMFIAYFYYYFFRKDVD